MTSDYVLSHYDAMALWDAVLDVEPDHTCTTECDRKEGGDYSAYVLGMRHSAGR